MRPHLLLAVLLAGLFYIAGQYVGSSPARTQQEAAFNRQLTVQGHGEVHATPNIARITLGVQTGTQPNAKVALDLLGKKSQDITAAIRALGVKEEDTKTTNLSVQPEYDYTNGRQTPRGFLASESFEIKIRDLGKIGDVIARTTLEGVNQVGGVAFEIDDPSALELKAKEAAIKKARENAENLAKALGVHLGDVKSFDVSANRPGPMPYFAAAESLGAADKAITAPIVAPGTQDVTADVTITYTIR